MGSSGEETSVICSGSTSDGSLQAFADSLLNAAKMDCSSFTEMDFKPQQELPYNKHLPYYDSLKDEAIDYLKRIKGNLSKSLLLSEPDSMTWIEDLVKYIKLYGRYFSKEDHLYFIKLFLEVIAIPDLDPRKIHWFITVLYDLLKKPELLSPDELVIEWRPLYDLYIRMFYNSFESYGLHIIPESFDVTFKVFLKKARLYFPVSATQEIMNELRPLLCVYNSYNILKATSLLSLFLPTLMKPEHHDKGFKIWLDELLTLWDSNQNTPQAEENLVCLFSQLAKDNIGYINWDPHIPKIFTRLLRSFNILGGARKIQIKRNFNICESTVWIVSMLGGPSSTAMDHVSKLFSALESYYHPSNNGKWILILSKFLATLPFEFINRLHVERYKTFTWEPQIPSEYKLKEEDITRFVNIMKPIILMHMFSRFGESFAAYAWQLLSTVRPEIVIPPLIEKLYSSLETITEPHRLISTLWCGLSVSRNMVSMNKYYPEGQTHVIPLLFQALPGLDSNDIKKCISTFQFISTFVSLIPLIDCSSEADRADLTDTQSIVCSATSQWEDFVFQFIERCFVLIDNSSNEHKPERRETEALRLNEDGITELGLTSTFGSLLYQSSPSIYENALNKVYSFVSSRILETKVAGRYAADMCRVLTIVNPEMGLKKFLPHFSKLVLSLSDSDEVFDEENLDQQLVFSLLVLSEIVRGNGKCLLTYKDLITKVLQRSLKLKSRRGYIYGCNLLLHTLKSLTTIYSLEFRSFSHSWEEMSDFSKSLPLQYWGIPGDLKNLKINWHLPSDEEVQFAQKLLNEFLLRELNYLKELKAGNSVVREDVHRSLNIVLEAVTGVASSLPMWTGNEVSLPESLDPKMEQFCSTVPSSNYTFVVKETGLKPINFISGDNVRQTVAEAMSSFLSYIQSHHEDDTKSLLLVIKIIQTVLFSWGISSNDFDMKWKNFHLGKRSLENKLQKKKRHLRVLLINRVLLQHELRMKNKVKSPFTQLHSDLLQDLLSLSISHYSCVRTKAQESLFTFFKYYSYSHTLIVPKIIDILSKNTETSHEEFKGALHVLLGKKELSILTVSDWHLMNSVWLALVNGKYSEKPSIITLIGKINDVIHKNADGIWIKHSITDRCKEIAKRAWVEGVRPYDDCPSSEEICNAIKRCDERNKRNLELYNSLVAGLSGSVDDGNLHWRYSHLAFSLLCLIIRRDVLLPKEGVDTVVKNLISENIDVRKLSITAVAAILKQQKQIHPKCKFNPSDNDLVDNEWLQYNPKIDYLQEDVWNNTTFVEKNHWCFYSLPKEGIDIYEPQLIQSPFIRTVDQLREEEKPIFNFFTQQENVDKLLAFLSLEERKGHDKFSAKRFQMFKSLFRNFGLTFLTFLKEKISVYTTDLHESSQRCAAEVIAGLVRGSKHWSLNDVIEMKNFLEPLIIKMMDNMTTETFRDWGTCIATCFSNRDGRKLSWLVKLMVDDPLNSKNSTVSTEVTTSFLQSSRIYCLLGVVQQQSWRGLSLLSSLLDYLTENDHLTHSYENVRERIGFLLSRIFLYDTCVPCLPGILDGSPKRHVFISQILPKLDKLMTVPSCENTSDIEHKNGYIHKSPEEKEATNLLKTICKWILCNFPECPIPVPSDFFSFLPVLCEVQSETKDEAIVRESLVAIILLSHALMTPKTLRIALETCKEIYGSNSWHARSALTKFLQYMVSANLFTIMSDEEIVKEVTELVLNLLGDDRIEVREMAAQTLGDLVHCEFVKVNDSLVNIFRRKCRNNIRKTRSDMVTVYNISDIIERHSGVLGLCAIVNAYPYDVPSFLPNILMLLAVHVNDPQPISGTVKKTLSNFRRTHHDNWRDHKLQFSEEQLSIITDLLVSPSYYA